jgi:hypothetical protein
MEHPASSEHVLRLMLDDDRRLVLHGWYVFPAPLLDAGEITR